MNKEVKLNFVHLCDNAFWSADRKLNLIGIFTNINAFEFPVVHPTFSVAVNFVAKNFVGKKNTLFITLLDEDENEVGEKLEVKLNIAKDEQEINFIGNVVNTLFERPGSYSLNLELEEMLIAKVPLFLNKI